RLNSFRVSAQKYWPGRNGRPTTLDLVERAARVKGLNCVDLNYPDHVETYGERELAERMGEFGVALNGYAMRYYPDAEFRLGASPPPDPNIRREASDMTKRGLDSLAAAGGRLMTLWMGQDGFDYSFQADYARLWDQTIAAVAEVADHDRAIDVSIEY